MHTCMYACIYVWNYPTSALFSRKMCKYSSWWVGARRYARRAAPYSALLKCICDTLRCTIWRTDLIGSRTLFCRSYLRLLCDLHVSVRDLYVSSYPLYIYIYMSCRVCFVLNNLTLGRLLWSLLWFLICLLFESKFLVWVNAYIYQYSVCICLNLFIQSDIYIYIYIYICIHIHMHI